MGENHSLNTLLWREIVLCLFPPGSYERLLAQAWDLIQGFSVIPVALKYLLTTSNSSASPKNLMLPRSLYCGAWILEAELTKSRRKVDNKHTNKQKCVLKQKQWPPGFGGREAAVGKEQSESGAGGRTQKLPRFKPILSNPAPWPLPLP